MDTESIKSCRVVIITIIIIITLHYTSSHGDRTSPLHRPISPHSPLFSLPLAVCRRIVSPHLVDTRVRNRPRALVRKPSKRKRLAHLENFISVHLVLEQWIPCCVRWRAIRRCKRLHEKELHQ